MKEYSLCNDIHVKWIQLAYTIPTEMSLVMMLLLLEYLIRNVISVISCSSIFKRSDIRMKPTPRLHKVQNVSFFHFKTLNLKQVLRPTSRQVKIAKL